MRILGIDPGIAITGWAVIDCDNNEYQLVDYGIISTDKVNSTSYRLKELHTDLSEIIDNYKPEYVGVELLLFNNNAKTAMVVGEARGVVLLTIEKYGVPVIQFTPPQIKNSITGSGRADKKQVQENVKRIFNLENLPKPDDAADAVAIAICCYDTLKMKQKITI